MNQREAREMSNATSSPHGEREQLKQQIVGRERVMSESGSCERESYIFPFIFFSFLVLLIIHIHVFA